MPGQSGSWTAQEIKSLDADQLKFSHYSRVLAQVILEADTPLSVGVFGPWGCGKTSLMRLVEESLQETSTAQGKKMWTVWFAPGAMTERRPSGALRPQHFWIGSCGSFRRARLRDGLVEEFAKKGEGEMSAKESELPAKGDVAGRVLAELLSNDLTRIHAALARTGKGDKEALAAQLVAVIVSGRPPLERVSAGSALALLGDPRPKVMTIEGMQFCYVPPGPFWMGSPDEDEMAYRDEKPLHRVDIPYGFWVARYPVTNAQFRPFTQDPEGYRTDCWWTKAGLEWRGQKGGPADYGEPWNLANHPVVGVSWYDAVAFGAWLEDRLQGASPLPADCTVPRQKENGRRQPAEA